MERFYMKKYILFVTLILFSSIFSGCSAQRDLVRIYQEYPEDERVWEYIFDNVNEENEYVFEDRPLGVILPHDNLTSSELAKFYSGLSKVADPSTVLIIGSNQSNSGEGNIQTCKNCIFSTIIGDLEVDHDFLEKMVNEGAAEYNNETFINDHAINIHSIFIKKYFPEAKIAPILVKWKIPVNEVVKLSGWLDENLAEDDLAIGSVNFSGHVPQGVAEFHDRSSFTTINNFDLKNIYKLGVDSPSTIYALLSLMRSRGYAKVEQIAYTNSANFIDEHSEETTSHQYIAFFNGEIDPMEGTSIMAFGNLPLDNSLTFFRGWEWDPNYNQKADYTTIRLLKEIRGKEDRFFVGSDYFVFDIPENDCLYDEINGVKIGFCKLVEGSYDLYGYRDFLEEKRENTDLLFLLFEFKGGGEIDYDRKLLIRDFAKRGVDIFVGRGLKDIIPFENYRGSLLFYSLGNFITDNKLAINLDSKSSGISLGIYIDEDYYYIYTFPIEINNGYPKLLDFSQRPSVFNAFIEEASLRRRSDSTDSKKGIVKIRR
ncbi:AmmeMemoRadiSam system protein B [Candidatus Peregrinibacteria bacterium]|nr:AmmeMemoRadiSam system protein B [Candidatus Peregrinibacteria bacterium]